jgi:hypothetical protein
VQAIADCGQIASSHATKMFGCWLKVEDNGAMPPRSSPRHPGPWRIMQTDAEFAGLLIAVGFVVMGLVALPIVRWFLIGALLLGGGVALQLRFNRKE